ncbi:M28 family metallopeptidase [Pedobacter sp. MW01-1-1]|uniref:M28 family metallopeptidase n=1 Tax=Pedobacter sp. MW01-1-1 TaxID=3383027 RepID=UPI003FF049D6
MKKLLCLFALSLYLTCSAQDSVYVRKTINTLTNKSYWGRGYTKNGMQKAGDFLFEEYKKIGLTPLATEYKQFFSYSVNTFPGKMLVKLNGINLVPGKDFLVNNESIGLKGKFSLQKIDSITYQSGKKLLLLMKDKLTWSVATDTVNFTTIQINKNTVETEPKEISIDIENAFIPNFTAANICGMVKGTKYPDSVFFITAHYDHLGGMGNETYFPGANDNAAGVATLLSLAKYYAQHPQPYSIAFICFAGEEAGLIGSRFYTENPLFPLKNIKFLLNLDLVGTGEKGMTVVNSTVYPTEFKLLNSINEQQKLISKINTRGKAANSDHYFFTEKGVPAFFFYTQGGPSAYHDIYDQSETLPITKYKSLFKLIIAFNDCMMQ